MAIRKIAPSGFSRNLALVIGMFCVLAIAFTIYVWSEKEIDRANETRYQSFLLAEELRQSSEDLTSMVRTYVATGDPIYKKYYQDILDIRNGIKQRPSKYWIVYWDLFTQAGKPPRVDSDQKISLLDLMRQAGFSEDEFLKLSQAKSKSDDLTLVELNAMRLVEKAGPEASANQNRAIQKLYDEK